MTTSCFKELELDCKDKKKVYTHRVKVDQAVGLCHQRSYTDDIIILLNFIFTGLHGYQIRFHTMV